MAVKESYIDMPHYVHTSQIVQRCFAENTVTVKCSISSLSSIATRLSCNHVVSKLTQVKNNGIPNFTTIYHKTIWQTYFMKRRLGS